MEKFSEACVVASTHSILLIQNAYEAGYLPRRNPSVIYFLFAASLVILSNEFAGLYTYGTQAAGEYVTSPQLMSLPRDLLQGTHGKTLQIVLDTQVTDGSAGPPRVVAVHEE